MTTRHIVLLLGMFIIMAVMISPAQVLSFPYKGLDLKIEGRIAEMYDDNIDSDSEGNTMNDFITKLTVDLGAEYAGKRRIFDFSGQVRQEIFSKHSNLNNISGDARFNFMFDFSKFDRLGLSNTFFRTFDPGSFTDEFGQTKGRNLSTSNRFNLFYRREFSEQFNITGKYSNEINLIEDSEDSYFNTLGLETSYIHDAATSFFLALNYARRDYDSTGNTFYNYSIASGLERSVTKNLQVNGSIGMNFIESPDSDGVAGSFKVGITNNIDENIKIDLSVEQGTQTTTIIEDFFESWKVAGSLHANLSEKLNFYFSGEYNEGTFGQTDISHELWRTDVSLTYLITKKLKGALKYTYSNRESNEINQIRSYERNRITSELIMVF